MKIIRKGAPIPLIGICVSCRTILQTDTAHAQRARALPPGTWSYQVSCPVCGHPVGVDASPVVDQGQTYRAETRPDEPPPKMISLPRDVLARLVAELDAAPGAHDSRHWRETCARAATVLADILRGPSEGAL